MVSPKILRQTIGTIHASQKLKSLLKAQLHKEKSIPRRQKINVFTD